MYYNIYVYIYKSNMKYNSSKHKTPYFHTHSFLSTTKHLGKIRRLGYIRFLYSLLDVNSLKNFFEPNKI